MALFILWVVLVYLIWAYRQLMEAVGYQNKTSRLQRETGDAVRARVEALEIVVAKLLEGRQQ